VEEIVAGMREAATIPTAIGSALWWSYSGAAASAPRGGVIGIDADEVAS
jgi:hypothetical protein